MNLQKFVLLSATNLSALIWFCLRECPNTILEKRSRQRFLRSTKISCNQSSIASMCQRLRNPECGHGLSVHRKLKQNKSRQSWIQAPICSLVALAHQALWSRLRRRGGKQRLHSSAVLIMFRDQSMRAWTLSWHRVRRWRTYRHHRHLLFGPPSRRGCGRYSCFGCRRCRDWTTHCRSTCHGRSGSLARNRLAIFSGASEPHASCEHQETH